MAKDEFLFRNGPFEQAPHKLSTSKNTNPSLMPTTQNHRLKKNKPVSSIRSGLGVIKNVDLKTTSPWPEVTTAIPASVRAKQKYDRESTFRPEARQQRHGWPSQPGAISQPIQISGQQSRYQGFPVTHNWNTIYNSRPKFATPFQDWQVKSVRTRHIPPAPL
jgi:hypothetical protein